ncbi:MAG: helix-turn-helix domain-containing protein [Rhodospirillales bacterium]|nr:helix-turn-helix domain-containing protein [Rhodospirillales bacterium]
MSERKVPKYTESRGNVFADLGFPNPEQEQVKAHLSREIHRIIAARKLTQKQTGALLGIHQSQVSALMRARPGQFSVGRLMSFLNALDQDVEIVVKPRTGRKRPARITVSAP